MSFQTENNGQNNFLANGGVYLVKSAAIFLSYGFTVGSKISLENDILPTIHRASSVSLCSL
jgi:hypothetical protein